MTIFYSCDKNRKLEVSVNGTKTVLKDLNSNNEVKSVTIPVSLKNKVTIRCEWEITSDAHRTSTVLQYPDNKFLIISIIE